MIDPTHIYALDIETLNDEARGFNGLDPSRSRITEIAVVADPSIITGGGVVFASDDADNDGSESLLLDRVQGLLADLPPGLITTWNGTFFDFPFMADRARILRSRGAGPRLVWGLRMDVAPTLRPKYEALPGHATDENPGGGYQVSWHTGETTVPHIHLDVSQGYRRFADEMGIKWGLKPVCAAHDIDMIELDRSRLHEYTPAEREAYNLSDGHGTRELALRLLGFDYPPYQAA